MNEFYKRSHTNYDPKYFIVPPSDCKNCICYFCYNKLCPHCHGYRVNINNDCVRQKNIRVKDMIPHRCDKCYFLWHKKKPIFDCDFYVNFRRKTKLFTVVRKYRKKSELQILSDKITNLEKMIEEMYNRE